MIFTFYRAMGYSVGNSMVEEDFIPMAKALMDKAAAKGVKFFLPTDVILADEFKADANSKVVAVNQIPSGWMGLDIGPESLATFKKELLECKTVVWNGPMVSAWALFLFHAALTNDPLSDSVAVMRLEGSSSRYKMK